MRCSTTVFQIIILRPQMLEQTTVEVLKKTTVSKSRNTSNFAYTFHKTTVISSYNDSHSFILMLNFSTKRLLYILTKRV